MWVLRRLPCRFFPLLTLRLPRTDWFSGAYPLLAGAEKVPTPVLSKGIWMWKNQFCWKERCGRKGFSDPEACLRVELTAHTCLSSPLSPLSALFRSTAAFANTFPANVVTVSLQYSWSIFFFKIQIPRPYCPEILILQLWLGHNNLPSEQDLARSSNTDNSTLGFEKFWHRRNLTLIN